MREKRSPVDRQWNILFHFPAPPAERIRACPHGHVFGCPVRDTPPIHPRVGLYLAYHPYWRRGFSWREFLREIEEAPHAVQAIQILEGGIGRYKQRQVEKAKSENEQHAQEIKGSTPSSPRQRRSDRKRQLAQNPKTPPRPPRLK